MGSTAHIVGADFQGRTGTSFLEVPYKGAAPALADITAQHIDLTFIPLGGPAAELIKSGAVKALALASAKRNPIIPDVPTFSEGATLKNFEHGLWTGIFAPPGTPEPIVARLTVAMNGWLKSSDYLERTALNGSRLLEGMTSPEAQIFLKSEQEKFARLARSLNLQMQ